jgi:hypothetical protein
MPTAPADKTNARVVIVACGGTKAITEGTIEAGKMYTGGYHKACREAAKTLGGTVFILSAFHGLVKLDEEIEPYNLKMGQPGSIDAGAVRAQAEWFRILHADVAARPHLLHR